MDELLHILASPAHWIFELISDIAFAIPVYYFGKWRVRAHDKKVHGK